MIDYTYEIEIKGVFVTLIEAELDVSVEWDGDQPVISVDDVLVAENHRSDARRVSLIHDADDAATKALGFAIMAAAEDDPDVQAQALDDAEIRWTGINGNDPDGQWAA